MEPLLKASRNQHQSLGVIAPCSSSLASLKQVGELPTKSDREGATLGHSAIYKINMVCAPRSSLCSPHQWLISRALTLETTAPTRTVGRPRSCLGDTKIGWARKGAVWLQIPSIPRYLACMWQSLKILPAVPAQPLGQTLYPRVAAHNSSPPPHPHPRATSSR